MSIPFQCLELGTYCYGGSSCNVSLEGNQVCLPCAEGWQNDFFMFHYPNCALPTLAVPIFFGIYSFFSIIGTIQIVLNFRNTTTKIQYLIKCQLILVFLEWCELLATFIDNNNRFIAPNIIGLIKLLPLFEIATEMNLMLLQSQLPVQLRVGEHWEKTRKKWKRVQVVWTFQMVIMFALYAAFSVIDYAQYNFWQVIGTGVTLQNWLLFGGVNVKQTNNLVILLNTSKNSQNSVLVDESLKGLKAYQKQTTQTLIFMCIACISSIVVVCVTGSFPFHWVFAMAGYYTAAFQYDGFLKMMRKPSTSNSPSDESKSQPKPIFF